ncbi:hypothetical protein WHZ78_25220 [Bradyrhizobium symbiodeficiens]
MDKFIPGFITPSLQARATLAGRFSFLNGCYAAAFLAAARLEAGRF